MKGKTVQLFLERLAGEKRKESADKLKSVTNLADWEEKRAEIKRKLIKSLGGLPKREALSWKLLGKTQRDDYTIENIIIDSVDLMPINLNLFIPKNVKGKIPALVFSTGHVPKTHEMHQHPVMGLVKQGVMVALFDCWGRGEREFGNEHFTAGALSWFNGRCMNRYFINDCFLVVDYLYTRDDVDKNRILSTGVSGGGNTAIFHAALDERISSVVSVCTISSFSDLINAQYSGCPEYYPIGLLNKGVDIQNIASLIAPRPHLMVGGGKDELNSIDSLKQAFEHIKYVYKLYGKPDNISYHVDKEGEHGYNKNMRKAMYKWFGLADDVYDEICEETNVLNFLPSYEKHLILYEYNCMNTNKFNTNIRKVLGLDKKKVKYNKISVENINDEFSKHIIETDKGVFISVLIKNNIKEIRMYISAEGEINENGNVFPMIRTTGELSLDKTPWDNLNYCSADRAVSGGAIVLGYPLCSQRVYDLLCVCEYVVNEICQNKNISIQSDDKLELTAMLFAECIDCKIEKKYNIEDFVRNVFEYASNNPGAGIEISEQICSYESVIPGIVGILEDAYEGF